MYIVYKTTNVINGKLYVGVHGTDDPSKFDGYLGSGMCIKRAIKKYGTENFKRETLLAFDNADDAYICERNMVTLEFAASDDNYNIMSGGMGGKHHSEETCKKISESVSGKNHPMYGKRGEYTSMWGRQHSAETREKMSKARKGKLFTEEHRRNLSESMAGEKCYNYGKHPSEETLKKMSDAHSGKKNHFYGKTHSDEAKKKISESRRLTDDVIKQRLMDIKVEPKTLGWQTRVSKKWGLGRGSVRIFLREYRKVEIV